MGSNVSTPLEPLALGQMLHSLGMPSCSFLTTYSNDATPRDYGDAWDSPVAVTDSSGKGVDHTVHAFRLRWGAATSPVSPPSFSSTQRTFHDLLQSSHINSGVIASLTCEAVNLSSTSVPISATEAYLVIHIYQPPGSAGNSSPPASRPPTGRRLSSRPPSPPVSGGRGYEHAAWLHAASCVCTPRGLCDAFSSDMGKPSLGAHWGAGNGGSCGTSPRTYTSRSTPYASARQPVQEVATHYSLHLLTGKAAHPILSAVGVLLLDHIEMSLKDSRLRSSLMYSLAPAGSTSQERLLVPANRSGSVIGALIATESSAEQQATRKRTGKHQRCLTTPSKHSGIRRKSPAASRRGGDAAAQYPSPMALGMTSLALVLGIDSRRSPGSPCAPADWTLPLLPQPPVVLSARRRLPVGTAASSSSTNPSPRLFSLPHSPPHQRSTTLTSGRTYGGNLAKPWWPIGTATESPRSLQHVDEEGRPFSLEGIRELSHSKTSLEEGSAWRATHQPHRRTSQPTHSKTDASGSSQIQQLQLPTMALPSDLTRDSAAGLEDDETRMTADRVRRLKLSAPEATEVLPWLFVGGEEAAKDEQQLLRKGVTGIVNTVAFDLPAYYPNLFHYCRLCLQDSPDEPIFSLIPLVNAFVEEERKRGGRVFIHCHQGVSRSCSFVIAYVMWYQGWCYDEAYRCVRARRTVCSPNAGFFVTLQHWQHQLIRGFSNGVTRVFAFTPFNSGYCTPRSFRLAGLVYHAPERNRQPDLHPQRFNDEEEAAVVSVKVMVVHEGDGQPVCLDPRLSYGLLLFHPATSLYHSAVLLPTDAARAEGEDSISHVVDTWENFLVFSGYSRSRKAESTSDANGVVTYYTSVLPGLERVFEQRLGNGDEKATSEAKKPKKEEPAGTTSVVSTVEGVQSMLKHHGCQVNVVSQRDDRWDGVLNPPQQVHAEITAYEAQLIAEASETQQQSRAQERAAALQRLAATLPPSLDIPLTLGPSPRGEAPNRASHGVTDADGDDDEDALLIRDEDVLVFSFPFTSSPLTDWVGLDDFSTEECYAIHVPNNEPRWFLWIGDQFGSEREEEVVMAYQDAAVLPSTPWRLLAGGTEVVREGAEPDSLLLAID